MVTIEFAETATELNEILKYFPDSEVEKIPLKLRKFLKEVENKSYFVEIDPYKTLDEQKIKEKTKDLITVIYRNYWCNEYERKEIDIKLIENDNKYEEELKKKYNPDNIFTTIKNPVLNNQEELIETKHVNIIVYKENILRKLFKRIKHLFIKK